MNPSLAELRKILRQTAAHWRVTEMAARRETPAGVVIYGAGAAGQLAYQSLTRMGVKPVAFADSDPGKWGKQRCGLNILPPEAIPREAIVCLEARGWEDAIYRELHARGHRRFATTYLWQYLNPETSAAYIAANLDACCATLDLLADDESRERYLRMLWYRLTLDPGVIRLTTDYQTYFHPGVHPADGEVVIDGGAYLGDTIQHWRLGRKIRLARVYAFEPDPPAYRQMAASLADWHWVTPVNLGLFDREGTVRFAGSHPGSSAIDPAGNDTVAVTALDAYVAAQAIETIDLIKLDVEGAEAAALAGARASITRFAPKLIVCLYHRTEHFVEIPRLVHALNRKYRMYVGQHQRNLTDTVLYAAAT